MFRAFFVEFSRFKKRKQLELRQMVQLGLSNNSLGVKLWKICRKKEACWLARLREGHSDFECRASSHDWLSI